MELQLFSDSETFTRKRPTITEAQKQEFYLMVAKEIVNNGWTKYGESVEKVAEIVADTFDEDNDAYLLAREFDNLGFKVNMDFCEEIVEWQHKYQLIVRNNISTWILAHNITPKYSVNDMVKFKIDVFPYFKRDEILEIDYLHNYNAKYQIKGMSIEWEIIEKHTELING